MYQNEYISCWTNFEQDRVVRTGQSGYTLVHQLELGCVVAQQYNCTVTAPNF